MFYYSLIFGVFLFSFNVFANVGSVDSHSDQKAAACTNAPESRTDQSVSREINPGNVLANLVPEAERSTNRRNRGRSTGREGSLQ